jgi:hypothetical protein
VRRASVELIVRALNDAEVPFLVVGGLAVVAHGYGRLTQDIDLVVGLDPESARRTILALEGLGYRPAVPVTAESFADPEQRARWIADKGMTVLHLESDAHRETGVDLFVSEPFDFASEHRLALVEELAPGVPIRIVRLATLLRMKAAAGRPQDVADIAELRALHGDVADG